MSIARSLRFLVPTALAASASVAAPAASQEAAEVTPSGFVHTFAAMPLLTPDGGEDDPVLGLEEAELDLDVTFDERAVLRFDLQYQPSSGDGGFDGILEQAHLRIGDPEDGFSLVAGKRNAPIGSEAIDAPGMYTWSHCLVYTYGTPTNLHGFFGQWARNGFSVMGWVTNDWDTPAMPGSASGGGRLQWANDSGGVGVASTWGPFDATDPRLAVDLDTYWTLGDVYAWAEVNYVAVGELETRGAVIGGNWAFVPRTSLTIRLDRIYADLEPAMPEEEPGSLEGSTATLALLHKLHENVRAIVEVGALVPAEDDAAVTGAVALTGTF